MRTKLLLTALFVFFLTSCGGGGGGTSNSTAGSSSSQQSATFLQAPSFWQTYSGTTDSVIPNITLPAGFYKITVITSKFAILHEVTTTAYLLNVSTGEASVGAEALFLSTGGSYTFQLSNIGADWTLAIQNIDFGSSKDISELGNTQETGPKVMGPFRVSASKTYLLTMHCDSFFIMHSYSPYTGQKGYIFNKSRGSNGAQTTAKFGDDLVLFQTENVDENPWSVSAQVL